MHRKFIINKLKLMSKCQWSTLSLKGVLNCYQEEGCSHQPRQIKSLEQPLCINHLYLQVPTKLPYLLHHSLGSNSHSTRDSDAIYVLLFSLAAQF